MAAEGVDPSLLQEFLTEANELIEQLDADLVHLEEVGEGPESADLLNGIFRALHTIKGAASFLALTTLTGFAHAAEDALNLLRKGEVRINESIMDSLLRSVDVLRAMLDDIAAGREITEAPQDLVAALHAVAEQAGAAAGQPAAGEQDAAPAEDQIPDGATPLSLPREKADLVEFMAADLRDEIQKVEQCIVQTENQAGLTDAAEHLAEIAGEIRKTATFFGLTGLTQLSTILSAVAPKLVDVSDQAMPEVRVRVFGVKHLMELQAVALDQNLALTWPLEQLEHNIALLLDGQDLDPDVQGAHGGDAVQVLVLDGVIDAPGSKQAGADESSPAPETASQQQEPAAKDAPAVGGDKKQGEAETSGKRPAAVVEQTIRVEVGRLEALLNLVGQLVLSKNRLMGLARRLREHNLPHETEEAFTSATGELDQLTGELQVGVMRTRMQPLAKLFDRYPRVMRDMARMTNKKIDLKVIGKDTEVDKSVLENLADPLVHILRNSADHGIESPQDRVAAGKPEGGTVRLSAEHQGSHVRIEIADDGKGLDREVIGNKAVDRGLVSAEQLTMLSDEEVFRFIFAAGFSTAAQVTDLSGRGVGMDVVRTNIAKLNGAVNVSSVKGEGTTIEVMIPLTVAIMPAMVVGVGEHLYAVPLASIVEIVRPEEAEESSVMGHPVMRLRDTVLPLMDLRERLDERGPKSPTRFAVVVGVGQQRVGLLVDRLIGQEEVVIKALDDQYANGGPFSGATIREDGSVSLIVDVMQIVREAQLQERAAA